MLDLRWPPHINGEPAIPIAADERVWFRSSSPRSGSELLLGVETPPNAPERLHVRIVGCEGASSWHHERSAEPLSTTNPLPHRLHQVQHFAPQAWVSGRSSDFALLGSGVAVVARGSDGLRILEAGEPEQQSIREIAHVAALPGDDINDVAALNERYVVAASAREGLLLFDLEDPTAPVLLDAGFPRFAPRDGHNLFVRNSTVFVAHSSAFRTGWLSALSWNAPRLELDWVLEMPSGHDAHDVFVSGDYAFVSSLRGGLYVVELGQPPALIDHWDNPDAPSANTHSAAVIEADERDFWLLVSEEKLGGRLQLLRWSAEQGFELLESYRSPLHRPARPGAPDSVASPHKFACHERACYVAHYQQGLERLTWSPPNSLELTAWFPTWPLAPRAQQDLLSGATGVALAGPHVWVLDTHGGLYVVSPDE